MTIRTSSCVVIRERRVDQHGETHTTYYGPFLPHAGGATKHVMWDLEAASERRGDREHDLYLETVFIGPEESDCKIVATR